ncbi:MAG: branched-chain amino acid transport system II carrier protein [Aquaticitalea sp.]
MDNKKQIFITGFALFSMFFGAGNLILPPFLGFQAGTTWFLVAVGFVITAVIIPLLGILAHAKLQGTMYDFAKKVSPLFSLMYCLIVYVICIALPAPRTASVTHEMAIAPFFGTNPLLTSSIYFGLVFIFVMNRAKILDVLGKFLTPIIIIILLAIISIGIMNAPEIVSSSHFDAPLVNGILEGYQTFDAIGAIVVGAVLVISLNYKSDLSFEDKKTLIKKSGFVAGFGLFVIYAGLILIGSLYNGSFDINATRSEVLIGLTAQTLGSLGTTFLSVLIALACFTTAVGIITGTSDYFKGLFKNSHLAYTITAVVSCAFGVLVGSYNVGFIIDIALPVLMFIYPITIILIILNVFPDRFATPTIFRSVVLVTFIFSIPDFLKFVIPIENIQNVIDVIPLSNHSLGWVLPALLTFVFLNVFVTKKV